MRRWCIYYLHSVEGEHDLEAEDEAAARAAAWAWMETTYPGDTALEIIEIEDIT